MIGEASGIAPDRGLNILYRVTMNTLMNLSATDLTQDNRSGTQALANTRLSADTPKGLLAGSVVKVSASGVVEKAVGSAAEPIVGVVINNAVGYPFESSSGVASGKCPYLCGSGTVFATDVYETASAGGVAFTYTAGDLLYSSAQGLLVNFANKPGAADVVVGVVLIAPSASDPFMVVQMVR